MNIHVGNTGELYMLQGETVGSKSLKVLHCILYML